MVIFLVVIRIHFTKDLSCWKEKNVWFGLTWCTAHLYQGTTARRPGERRKRRRRSRDHLHVPLRRDGAGERVYLVIFFLACYRRHECININIYRLRARKITLHFTYMHTYTKHRLKNMNLFFNTSNYDTLYDTYDMHMYDTLRIYFFLKNSSQGKNTSLRNI